MLDVRFSYDPLGNRLTDKYGNYVYDAQKQRLKEDYQYVYLYDNNGNIIYKNSKDSAKLSYQYEYTSTNQLKLIKVLQKTISSPLGEVKKEVFYRYDVLGRRLRKEVIDHENQSDITKNYKIHFIYRGDNIAVELDANDNVLLAQHFHSPLKPDDILKSSYTDRAKELGFVKNAGVFTYIKDHLGTVTEIVDNNGSIKQRYSYTSYGFLRSISNGDGSQDITLNPEVKPYFTYTGREWDSEVGLYYYRARYYDANTGRFLQQDPDPGKLVSPNTFLSKYIYVSNSPVMHNDPTGKFWVLAAMFGVFGKDIQKIAIIGTALVLGAIAGPIVAGYLGLAAGTAGAIVTSTLVGAAAGGTFAAIAYPAAGLGTSEEGFMAGAIAGGLGGLLAGAGAFGKYPVSKFKTGNIVKGINNGINNFIKGLANGPAEGVGNTWTGAEFINPASDFAGFIAGLEPALTGAGIGLGLNAIAYGCASGNCNIPKFPIINDDF